MQASIKGATELFGEGQVAEIAERGTQIAGDFPPGEMEPDQAAAFGVLVREAGLRDWIKEQKTTEEYREEAKFATPRPIGGGNFAVGAPEAPRQQRLQLPALPTGLEEFAPKFDRLTGQVGEIVSPSGQALGRLTFTEREQLAGVVEFGGGQFRDVLERVRRETPFAPRSGGRTRAFRQRAGVTF